MSDMLMVKDLSITDGDTILVDGLSFSLTQGQLLSVVGQSGAGKSLAMLSLLGMHANLTISGQAMFCGEHLPIDNVKNKRWYDIRGKRIGYIFQDPKRTFNPLHTVGTAFKKVFAQMGVAKKQYLDKTLQLLTQVKLPNPQTFLNRYPHQLSGGEAQRIAIALTLALNPLLIIADEPTSSLDEQLKTEILALLRDIADNQRAIIVISHDVAYLSPISDKYLVVYQGRQVAYGDDMAASLISMEGFLSLDLGVPTAFDVNQRLLLAIHDLTLSYKKSWFERSSVIVSGLHLDIYQGQIVGLVGCSGIGKSSIAKAIVRLDDNLRITGQMIFFDKIQSSQDVLTLSKRQLQAYRPKVMLMMQDVAGSLNPDIKIINSISEGCLKVNPNELNQLLTIVGLDDDVLHRYPRQLSGGECTRVCLLRALLVKPQLLILDEPTAMLDGCSTWQVVQLLKHINQALGISILLISHDKQVIKALCHQVITL